MASSSVYKKFYSDSVSDCSEYFLSEIFSDVEIICKGGRIKAHRSRLSSVSPFFNTIFCQDSSEKSVLIFPDVNCDTMRLLLSFIYTGVVKVNEDEMREMFEVIKLLQIANTIDVERVYKQINHSQTDRKNTPLTLQVFMDAVGSAKVAQLDENGKMESKKRTHGHNPEILDNNKRSRTSTD